MKQVVQVFSADLQEANKVHKLEISSYVDR